ncbi:MAG: lytic transglycosylase domain-containing protein [Clostridiaceae bacterium]|jgi:soluble lytic murein transglycosylase-like protein|nr:lytic transglycosylase domain-containing protein [Clostridiaceae bacterium]
MKPMISVRNILQKKISDIQSRLPIPIRSTYLGSSFSHVLNEATNKNMIKTRNPEITLDTSKKLYPRVSGSYEAEYPFLSQDEISELMPEINEAIQKASVKYGVDQNMIRAIIKQESSFQPFALSTSGAMGLMQLMPGTASLLSVTDPYDIEQNIMGGTRFFKAQLDAFDGSYELALAAYNAGPNNVRKYGGIPPFPQAQNFVKNVMEYYKLYVSSSC